MPAKRSYKKTEPKQRKIAMAHMKKEVYQTVKRMASEEQRSIGAQAQVMLEKHIEEHNLW